MGRDRLTVCHVIKEWARDGDGVRAVHVNTIEGLWTGLRNFLRTFRGVSKKHLYPYVAMFEWGDNTKAGRSGVPLGHPGGEIRHHLTDMSQQSFSSGTKTNSLIVASSRILWRLRSRGRRVSLVKRSRPSVPDPVC